MSRQDPIIRSFGSREQANKWAYENGKLRERLYIVTENVKTPFTYWVLCENSFRVARSVPQSYRLLSVYD